MDWLMTCLLAGVYFLAGGLICTAAFSTRRLCCWLDAQPAWLDLLIWALWPVSLPLCAWLVHARSAREG